MGGCPERSGISILGGTQYSPGDDPEQPGPAGPALSRDWARGPPEVLSNLHDSFICGFHELYAYNNGLDFMANWIIKFCSLKTMSS